MTTRILLNTSTSAAARDQLIEPVTCPKTGYWRVFNPDGAPRNSYVPAAKRALLDREATGNTDTYVSQNVFSQHAGTVDMVKLICGAWVDLDIHTVPGMAEWGLLAKLRAILEHCDASGVPRPSYTVFSGRGFYLKWPFRQPVAAVAAPRCRAVNVELARVLAPFGADLRAVDMARILRVVGSVNSKSGETVCVVHREENGDDDVVRYSLDELADRVLPLSRAEIRERREERRTSKRPSEAERTDRRADRPDGESGWSTWPSWRRKVLNDLARLIALRWPGRTVPEGWRDTFVYLAAIQLAHLNPPNRLAQALHAWGRDRIPADYLRSEAATVTSTIRARAHQASRGERVDWDGRDRPPVYTPSRATMVTMLKVCHAESRQMQALIDDAEYRRRAAARQRKARRTRGCRPAGEHQDKRRADADTVAETIAALKDTDGMSWREVAKTMGMTREAVRARYNRARKRETAGPASTCAAPRGPQDAGSRSEAW